MKKLRQLILFTLLAVTIASVSVFAAACVDKNGGGHKHTWGEWVLEVEPTLDAPGTATRTCTENDGGKETKNNVPALSDSSVWTKDAQKSTPATHSAGGKDVYTSVYGEVEVDTDPEGHDWNAWELVKKPTLDTAGSATRACKANDGGTETKNDVPALSDSSVWTKDAQKSIPATHTSGGKDVYTSVYGEVEVITDAVEHTWGEWTITENPTTANGGKAEHSCTAEDGGYEEVDIPALSDSSVWTVKGHTDATYEEGSKTVYESVYGIVTVEDDDVIPPPVAGKTYHSFAVDGKSLNTTLFPGTGNRTASITFNEKGEGTSLSAPFNGTLKVTVVNATTGELSVSVEKDGNTTVKKAYMHFATGLIILPDTNSFDYVHVLVTTGEYESRSATVSASSWKIGEKFNMAIEYSKYRENSNDEEEFHYDYKIFIIDDVVYFDVTFNDINGNNISSSSLYKTEYLYVRDKNGDLLAAYGYNEAVSNHVELDGLEGNYNVLDNEEGALLFLSGFGTAKLTVNGKKYNGTYEEGEGNYDFYLATEYGDFELTFEENGVSLVALKVIVTFDLNGHGDAISPLEIGKNRVFELPVPAYDNGWLFLGWYLDENLENPADVNGKAAFGENITLHAKWIEAVPYYGDYSGWELYGSGNTPSTFGSLYSISVDNAGAVTGGKSGTLSEYNEETGYIKFDNRVGAFDTVNGVLIFNDSNGGTDIKNDIHVMLRGKKNVACATANSSQWSSGVIKLLSFTYDGGSMIVFVWNNKVWGNVSVASENGTVTAGNAKTAESFSVTGSNGRTVAFYKDGKFVASDGWDGTYKYASGENIGDIVLDGAGNITAGESTGTYVVTGDNTFEVIFKVVSANAQLLKGYTLVIDSANGTYSATEKTVEVVTLTIIFAQTDYSEKEQFVLELVPNTIPDLSSYVIYGKNSLGYYFHGWYEDADRQTYYTPSALSADKTIYAGWSTLPYYIEHVVGGHDSFVSSSGTSHANHKFIQGWEYSEESGTWTAKNTSATVDISYILNIIFVDSGIFSFDYSANFADSTGSGSNKSYYDFLCGTKNPDLKLWPHDLDKSKDFLFEGGKSGNSSIRVSAGDFIYIEAYWDTVSSSSNDKATLSNFKFVAD